MKKNNVFLAVLSIFLLIACNNDIDPVVDTLYFNSGQPDTLRNQAITKLYEYYSNSDKSKEFYEVVSEKTGDYIINYYPSRSLLTVCFDPGSGWGGQYKNVDKQALYRLSNARIKLDNLQEFVAIDSTIDDNRPIFNVKTNGKIN